MVPLTHVLMMMMRDLNYFQHEIPLDVIVSTAKQVKKFTIVERNIYAFLKFLHGTQKCPKTVLTSHHVYDYDIRLI